MWETYTWIHVFPIENGGFYDKLLGFVFVGDFLRRIGIVPWNETNQHQGRVHLGPMIFGSRIFQASFRVANPSGESLLSFNSGFCQELLDTIHSEHCIIIAASQKVVDLIFFCWFQISRSG